jgi:hypothetical protein
MSTKPTRHGARWTKQEEEEILASIKSGLSLRIIATRKQRTTGGIRSRLTQVACRFVEVDKMPLYEAAERTGIKPAHLRAVLSLKMEPAPPNIVPPTPKMDIKFQTTFNRTALQGRAEEMRKAAEAAKLWQRRQNIEGYVNQTERSGLYEAAAGKSFYLYEVRLRPHDCTNEDILQGFRQKFAECTVTLAEDWVDVPNRHPGQPPTRILKSGIKIDWS